MVGRLVVRFLVWGRLADDGAAARVACALATAHASSLSLPFLPATQTAEYVCLVRAGDGKKKISTTVSTEGRWGEGTKEGLWAPKGRRGGPP